MKKSTLVLALLLLSFSSIKAQTEAGRARLGIGITQDQTKIFTVDHDNDNKTISGFLIGRNNSRTDSEFNEVNKKTIVNVKDFILAARVGYKLSPKVSLISSTGVLINKETTRLVHFREVFNTELRVSHKIYSALELNIKLIDNISLSSGYGTRGFQASLHYAF